MAVCQSWLLILEIWLRWPRITEGANTRYKQKHFECNYLIIEHHSLSVVTMPKSIYIYYIHWHCISEGES
ncbi:hypothetical protein EMIT0P265_110181 [Pseudomonas zeae]